MKRRDFIRISSLTLAALAIPRVSKATGLNCFPPGVVYTKEAPGKWAKKVGSHAPKVKVEGRKVTIETVHPMTKAHFIVRHTLVSEAGEVLGAKTFTPEDKRACSSHEIPTGAGNKFFATSFCNLHDFWVTPFSI